MFSSLRLTRNGSKPKRPVHRFRPRLEMLEERQLLSVLLVDDDHVQKPSAQYTSIQAAVNAANPGDEIQVYGGTYNEQVLIQGAGKNNLKLTGFDSQKPIIAPAGSILSQNDAAITVNGSTGVTIRGFKIGPNSAANGVGLDFGVRVNNNGAATIRDNIIHNILDANGAGIVVGRDTENTNGSASIYNNTIDHYTKAGIVISNTNSTAEVWGNTVTGSGPTALVQYGIQVDTGASAYIHHNCISQNIHGVDDGFESAGILLLSPGCSTLVTQNTVSNNQDGIFLFDAGNVVVSHNSLTDNTADAITLVDSSTNSIIHNCVSNNGRDGISVYGGANNCIAFNASMCNAQDGIYLQGTTTNEVFLNIVSSNGLHGIGLFQANGNALALNHVECNAADGINLEESGCNFLAANFVRNNNHDGVALYNSDNNVIWLNNIEWNDRYGIFLDSSSTDNDIAYNLVKHNRVKDAFDGTFDGNSVDNDWDHNIGRTDNTGGELLD